MFVVAAPFWRQFEGATALLVRSLLLAQTNKECCRNHGDFSRLTSPILSNKSVLTAYIACVCNT